MSVDSFIKAYEELPFHGMLVDVREDDEFCIEGRDLRYGSLGGDDYNYSGWITGGIQREEGWVMVNVATGDDTWVTMLFKEENEVK